MFKYTTTNNDNNYYDDLNCYNKKIIEYCNHLLNDDYL